MDRVEIKEEAKRIVKTNKWNIWKPFLVLAGISFIISIIIAVIGNVAGLDAETTSSIAESVASLVLLPVTVGILGYVLKLVRGQEFSLDDMKKYYPLFVKILVLDILVSVFVFLWSLLLIIPGIIAALSYSMVYYILIDNEELSASEIIARSKDMMKGYKLDWFIFNLSFIGWFILTPFTLGLLLIWLYPYVIVAEALYYDKLAAKYNSKHND